ncbi:protein unc-13 homolog 4B isoform X2 [Ischnura elegans]|uniref:protein unc-13 homolog 4B isoform X2 n=1 Tax=Ischnura elegans TaxID=197161 RepID=UPI001ED88A2F|nr:protein unc-13 homolog 4B isoform X2 [Ischnura elegans]
MAAVETMEAVGADAAKEQIKKKKSPSPWKPWKRKARRVGQMPGVSHVDGGFFEKFGSLLKHPDDHPKGSPRSGRMVRETAIRRKRSAKLAAAAAAAAVPVDAGVAVSGAEEDNEEEVVDGVGAVAEEMVAMEIKEGEEQLREKGEEEEEGEGEEEEEEDEGVGSASPHTSDSEPEESENKPKDIISNTMVWNLEELYSEVLYEILHMIGDGTEEEREELYSYLREAFKFDEEKHNSLLEAARAKEAPDIVLNVEVIEAKELKPKDANGLSDPYCTLYLTSGSHRYNTSVKSETLQPSWEEHFSLPLQKCLEDQLNIEVWDFDPAETVAEKMKKIGGVKGVKGLRKLMKEIAVTASTGKHNDELIGSHVLPIKSIPVTGQTLWCPLEKKGKGKVQGMVKLKLAVGAVKNFQVAMQEHRSLVKMLLLYELEKDTNSSIDSLDGLAASKPCRPYSWSGEFSSKGVIVLTQHLAQAGINAYHQFLAQWIEYTSIHVDHPLHFAVFSRILDTLVPCIQGGNVFSEDEVKMFWDSYKKLLPSCFNCLKKVRRLSKDDKSAELQLRSLLSIFAHLKSLECPDGIELFSPTLFSWFKTIENGCDIEGGLHDAVTQCAQEWVYVILEENKMDETSDDTKLKHAITVTQKLRSDLQKALDFHEKHFQEILHFPYTKTLYKVYDYELSEVAKPIVTDACWKLKPLRFSDNPEDVMTDSEHLQMGTSLFELYLILQRFAILAGRIYCMDMDGLKMQDYHNWFTKGVAHWLDIALFKALQRIEKAVELDALVPVDASVQYSSSAVDTLAIYYQIKIFWNQLSWPDVEGSYSFIAKIIDDICRCSVYYADMMAKKVDGLGESENAYEKKFVVTNEWCLAINNIGYIQESLAPFVQELGTDAMLNKLADYQSETAADHCRETLKLVVSNAEETVGNKIVDLIQMLTDKMSPAMQRFLQEGAELLNQENNIMDRLMQYLDENLMTLHSNLSDENFDRTLEIVWANVEAMLLTMIETGVEKRRPPSFFANLHETLRMLLSFFRREEQCCQMQQQQQQEEEEVHVNGEDGCEEKKRGGRRESKRKIDRMESLLSLHGMETCELIQQYHLERLGEQLSIEGSGQASPFGLLTVRLQFVEDVLRIGVMNARNLKPMDSNGSCDPFVRIHLLPEEKFTGTTKPRTKTHKKTLFPLFDEVFTVQMSSDLQQTKDGLVHFVVKDYDMISANEFIAEAYVPFSKIPSTDITIGLETLPQVHLPLTRPTNPDSKVLLALEHRHGDKLARDFYKNKKSLFSH